MLNYFHSLWKHQFIWNNILYYLLLAMYFKYKVFNVLLY